MNTCMVMFFEGYDMQVTSNAAPAVIKAWHLTSAHFGPVFGFGLLGYFLGATILDHVGDRFGRKKDILGGAVLRRIHIRRSLCHIPDAILDPQVPGLPVPAILFLMTA